MSPDRRGFIGRLVALAALLGAAGPAVGGAQCQWRKRQISPHETCGSIEWVQCAICLDLVVLFNARDGKRLPLPTNPCKGRQPRGPMVVCDMTRIHLP